MNFFEAVKALDRGQKIRDKDWADNDYIFKDSNGKIIDEEGNTYSIHSDIDYDWEIYKLKPRPNTWYKVTARDNNKQNPVIRYWDGLNWRASYDNISSISEKQDFYNIVCEVSVKELTT